MAFHGDIERWRGATGGADKVDRAAALARAQAEARVDEELRVVAWRFDQLVAHNYAARDAKLIARDREIDLEAARRLVTRLGCPPGLAARILL